MLKLSNLKLNFKKNIQIFQVLQLVGSEIIKTTNFDFYFNIYYGLRKM